VVLGELTARAHECAAGVAQLCPPKMQLPAKSAGRLGVFAGICFGFGRVLVERKGGVAGGRGQRRDWPEIKLRGGRRAATRLGRRSLASRVGTVMDKMIDQGVQETA
jgi:hypothetical protein